MPCDIRTLILPAFTSLNDLGFNEYPPLLEMGNAVNYIRDFTMQDTLDWTIAFPFFGTSTHPITVNDFNFLDGDCADTVYRNFLFVILLQIFQLYNYSFYDDGKLWAFQSVDTNCARYKLPTDLMALLSPGYVFSIGPNFTEKGLLHNTITIIQRVLSELTTLYATALDIQFNATNNDITQIGFQYSSHTYHNYTCKYQNPFFTTRFTRDSIFNADPDLYYNWNNPWYATYPDDLFFGRSYDFSQTKSNNSNAKFACDNRFDRTIINHNYAGTKVADDDLNNITIDSVDVDSDKLSGNIFLFGEGLANIYRSMEDNVYFDWHAHGAPETNPSLPQVHNQAYRWCPQFPHEQDEDYDPDKVISDYLPNLLLKNQTGTISITPYTIPFAADVTLLIDIRHVWGWSPYSTNPPAITIQGNIGGASFTTSYQLPNSDTIDSVEIDLGNFTLSQGCAYNLEFTISPADFKSKILENFDFEADKTAVFYAQFTESGNVYTGVATELPHKVDLSGINDNTVFKWNYSYGSKNHDIYAYDLNTYLGGITATINWDIS
jgi:hypothetical protein